MNYDNFGNFTGDIGGGDMVTTPRPWPNNAEAARMNSISAARNIKRLLDQALDKTTNPEALRLIAKAICAAGSIETNLIEVKGDTK